jgi:hypothetical protein
MARTGFWSAPNSGLRCSDAEREQVAGFLRDRAAEGRLTPDELGERVGLAYRAVTIGELERLVFDLPGSPFGGGEVRRARRFRPAVIGVAVVALLAALLPGPVWVLWWIGLAIALTFAVMMLALGLMLSPFAVAAAAVLFALRRIGGAGSLQWPRHPRAPRPPTAG